MGMGTAVGGRRIDRRGRPKPACAHGVCTPGKKRLAAAADMRTRTTSSLESTT
jgi:hypothetical protein